MRSKPDRAREWGILAAICVWWINPCPRVVIVYTEPVEDNWTDPEFDPGPPECWDEEDLLPGAVVECVA